jgi:hypothetical protein
MDEKRKSLREDVSFPARLSIGDFSLDATVINLSAEGAMFSVSVQPIDRSKATLGAECLFEIDRRDEAVRVFNARIVRIFDLEDDRLGMAITF